MATTAFLHRVRLKNYRSIGACDVTLGPLTFLVGPNGSGKSNFVDALRFVSDALNQSLDHAIRDRGGFNEVRRRSGEHPTSFGMRLDFSTAVLRGRFALEIGPDSDREWAVRRESCYAEDLTGGAFASYEIVDGKVKHFGPLQMPPPVVAPDRLFLTAASGLFPFGEALRLLTRMGFYNLNYDAIRELQVPDASHIMRRDGSNAAGVLKRLEGVPQLKQQLIAYLKGIAPGIEDVRHVALGPRDTIEFLQHVQGADSAWQFTASSMSDGTIRALGILLALLQTGNGTPIPLVGIEEPETALHPAAAGVLLDALRDAATHMQVLVTSHSGDLLDDKDIADDTILAVVAEGNETRIGPLDKPGREALRERLYTAGELLRMNQLSPDTDAAQPRQLDLFGDAPAS